MSGDLRAQEDAFRARRNGNGEATSHLTGFEEIVARPVRWAWQDRAALAKITALAGRPKIGKGLLYSNLRPDRRGHAGLSPGGSRRPPRRDHRDDRG